MKSSVVDVVMCTYNGEKFLAQQINSILRQTHQDFRLFIFDDCSQDNTVDIILRFQKISPKIVFHKNPVNIGFVKNFEQGIATAEAPLIALADQDDIWNYKKLETQIRAMQGTCALPKLINTDLQVIDEHNRVIHPSFLKLRGYSLPNKDNLHRILTYNGVMGCTILMNQLLKKEALPFPSRTDFHDYWLAVLNESIGQRITIHQPLVAYRMHTTNASNTIDKFQKKFAQKNKPELPFINRVKFDLYDRVLAKEDLAPKHLQMIRQFQSYLKGDKHPIQLSVSLLRHRYFKFNLKLLIIIILLFRRYYVGSEAQKRYD